MNRIWMYSIISIFVIMSWLYENDMHIYYIGLLSWTQWKINISYSTYDPDTHNIDNCCIFSGSLTFIHCFDQMSVQGSITEPRLDCENFTVVNVSSTNLCKDIDTMGQASRGSSDRGGERSVWVCVSIGKLWIFILKCSHVLAISYIQLSGVGIS